MWHLVGIELTNKQWHVLQWSRKGHICLCLPPNRDFTRFFLIVGGGLGRGKSGSNGGSILAGCILVIDSLCAMWARWVWIHLIYYVSLTAYALSELELDLRVECYAMLVNDVIAYLLVAQPKLGPFGLEFDHNLEKQSMLGEEQISLLRAASPRHCLYNKHYSIQKCKKNLKCVIHFICIS